MTTTILTDERIFALAAEADITSIDPKVDALMFSRDEMLQAGCAPSTHSDSPKEIPHA